MSGSVTNSGNLLKLLWPGVNVFFGDKYKDWDPEYPKIFMTFKSDKAYEEDVAITSMGLASRKFEGDAIQYDSVKQDYIKRYVNVAYGKGFVLTLEAQQNVVYAMDLAKRLTAHVVRSMHQTKEIVGANVLNNATSTSVPYLMGDGVALLSASHPLGAAGGVQSNLASVDISETALEDACIAIEGTLDSAGKRMALMPKRLIIPKESRFIVCRILKGDERTGTADRDINALKYEGYLQDVVVNHYLTDTDSWFIKTNLEDESGFKHFERLAPDVAMDKDIHTRNLITNMIEMYSFGVSDFRAVYGSMGV